MSDIVGRMNSAKDSNEGLNLTVADCREAADEIARLAADLEAAHALLGEWLAIPVENDAYADLRARTRELLDR